MGLNLVLCRIKLSGNPKYDPDFEEIEDFDSLRQHGDVEFWGILLESDFAFHPDASGIEVGRPIDFAKVRSTVANNGKCTERHLEILDRMENDEDIWLRRC